MNNNIEVREGQATRTTTPKKIVTFIVRVMGGNKAGYVDLSPAQVVRDPGQAYMAKQTLNAVPGQFFGRGPT